MTDDESRKAFEEYYLGQPEIEVPLERSGNGYKYLVADAVWRDWQAAVEWATRRERERYMKLFADALQDHDWSTNVSVRELLAMVMGALPQEHKP